MTRKSKIRWVYDIEDVNQTAVIPELSMLGYLHFTEAHSLPFHHHQNAFEFVFIESGKVTWEVNDAHFESRAGQLFYTQPGEWHRARMNYMEPCSIWWMVVNVPHGSPSWLGLFEQEYQYLLKQLYQLPRVFLVNVQMKERFQRLRRCIMQDQQPMKALKVRHLVLDIILALAEPESRRSIPQDIHQALLNMMEQFRRNPVQRWSNQYIADQIGVSESHLYVVFRNIFGQSPSSYLESLRIDYAGRMLQQSDIPITELALELEFKTSQHFATVFKKMTGLTPSEWRQQRQE